MVASGGDCSCDDGNNADVIADAGHARPQGTDAAAHQVDAHAGLRDHRVAGRAERAGEHVERGDDGFFLRGADDDALAGGQAVRLHDDPALLPAQVVLRRLRIGEALVGRGRDLVGAAEILGEALGAFKLRRGLAGAEGLEARGFEIVGDARAQRRLGPDHDEIDLFALGERQMPGHVLGRDVDAFGDLGDAGIAGGTEQLRAQGRGRNRPAKGVFAATAADDEDSHGEALSMVCGPRTSR